MSKSFVVGAVAAAGFIGGKVAEAIRARKANKTGTSARLPQASTPYSGSEDETGAAVRALDRPDGIELYTREFLVPSGTVLKGLVVLVHGWSFHSQYFADFALFLNKQGFVVVTFDLRGHGKSGRVDGIPGFAWKWSDYVGDVDAVLEWATERHPGIPCFLYGALVVSVVTAAQPSNAAARVKGVLLNSPALRVKPGLLPPPPALAALRTLSLPFPKMKLPNTVAAEFDDAFGDKELAARARQDGLCVLAAPRLASSLAVLRGISRALPAAKRMQTPWIAIHGALDTKTDRKNTIELHLSSQSADKTLKQYPDGHHALLQDTPEVTRRTMQDFGEWLLDHVDAA